MLAQAFSFDLLEEATGGALDTEGAAAYLPVYINEEIAKRMSKVYGKPYVKVIQKTNDNEDENERPMG